VLNHFVQIVGGIPHGTERFLGIGNGLGVPAKLLQGVADDLIFGRVATRLYLVVHEPL
jgi:hypothetical protein